MRTSALLLAAAWLAAEPLFSQNKGAGPVSPPPGGLGGATRAVVIGISDYQEKDIPDLRFADRDAEAFANYLRSPAGGSLDNDHLQVLTNQNATAGRVAEALDNLIEQAKEGDEVIIYFSGHGDVEGKKISQPGFLLCWDAPSRVYMGGGTYSLSFLQEVVTTLSVQSKAKVLVITDACHAGKLAGAQIGGAQLTTANLAKQFANEVKILSCQPNEFSLEGEQWGGGRGVFSYHLVDGLFGLADKNGDGSITVGEIDRYLEDHVTAEAAPQSQVPILLGSKAERLATVNPATLAALKRSKGGGQPVFAATESRGFEDEILAKADSSVRQRYLDFKKAVAEKQFFTPENDCAEKFYAQLSETGSLAPLRGLMKRNYAAALQDDAQQTLNQWLKTKGDIAPVNAGRGERLPQKVFTEKVKAYPRCLERAAELLGDKHYMYASLRARACFFEGYLLASSNRNPDAELGRRALGIFQKSLVWQPEQPHVYWQMSLVFAYNFRQPDSLEHYARLAMALHPNWVQPSTWAAFLLNKGLFGQPDRARPFLEEASQADPGSAEVLVEWALYYLGKDSLQQAEQRLKKAIAIDSTNVDSWGNLGSFYASTGRYDEGEPAMKKAIALDSTNAGAWVNLGYLYNQTRRYDEAEGALKRAVALDSTFVSAWNILGVVHSRSRRFDEAEEALKKAIALDPTNVNAWNNLGFLYFQTRRYPEAEPVLKKAIALDSTNVSAWVNLGFVYHQTRRFDEAEPVLKKAAAIDPAFTGAWVNLGYVYLQTRRYAEAEPALKKAIALDSTSASSRKHLGMVCFKTHRPDEARQYFLKAIELNPNYAGAMLGMAYVLFSEGKTAEALGYVEQAIGKGSTFEQLQTDDELAPLRALPEWGAMMKKHSPDKAKD